MVRVCAIVGLHLASPEDRPLGRSYGSLPAPSSDTLVHGRPPMEPLWTPNGAPMAQWSPYGPPMEPLWSPNGAPMEPQLSPYGPSMHLCIRRRHACFSPLCQLCIRSTRLTLWTPRLDPRLDPLWSLYGPAMYPYEPLTQATIAVMNIRSRSSNVVAPAPKEV